MSNTNFERKHPRQPDGKFAPKNTPTPSGVTLEEQDSTLATLDPSLSPSAKILGTIGHQSSDEYIARLDMAAQKWLNNTNNEQNNFPRLRGYLAVMSEGGPACDDDVIALADDLDFRETPEGAYVLGNVHLVASSERFNIAATYEACGRDMDMFWREYGEPREGRTRDVVEETISDYWMRVEPGNWGQAFTWSHQKRLDERDKYSDWMADARFAAAVAPEKTRPLLVRARAETARQVVGHICDYYEVGEQHA